ncbi:hypothetical protein HPB52_023773 [Rhipicephalus sanguineus]|uniref:Tick transposon n=1 Tax=Rhipicephalus sanguineus TaxID=34632 RepID=A0A9D4T0K0_RHISA|nr:hypothetical protein HPB52_023773 [Rhipicephalus sanguineus]
MEESNIRLAAVSDPYRPSRRIPAFPNGYLVYAVQVDPGAAVVTRNPPYDVCPICVTTNVVAIYCEAQGFSFLFVSVYAPPHSSLHPTLDILSDILRSARTPNIIVAGDFNAKHRMWGPTDPDERGLQIAQFSLANDLISLNDDQSLPTFETLYAASWIDLTFATPSVLASGFRWTVRDDTTFSEHRVVEVTVGDPPKSGKRLTSYAHCQLWTRYVGKAAIASPEALDRVLLAFQALYDKTYQRHLRPVRTRPTSKPWFTPDLAIERSAVAAKRRRFQRTRDVHMRAMFRQEYTSALAVYRNNIREARDVHIRGDALSCVHAYLFSRPFKEAFGRLRQSRCIPALVGSDGTVTSTHLESAALLLRTQITVDDHTTDEQMHLLTRSLASAPYVTISQDIPFTYSEVVDVLRNTPNKSAAGPDNITPVIMKALFQHHPRFFMMIFNAALALARVTFIHKTGRPAERTSSYRPICVSSVFGKTLERLLNGRLQHYLDRQGLIHPRQFGYTRGRSSILALHALKENLLRLKAQRMPAILMSLYFHGAFDSVWHSLILRYFRERGLPSRLYHLLRTFLTYRSVFVQSHAGHVEAHPTLGSPQGSPLSPLLWNVVIDSSLSLQMPPGVVVQAYADDTFILVPAPSRDALGILASEVLRRVIAWCREVKRACVRPAQKVLMYHQVILPALTYGSPVWWGESHVDCRLRTLNWSALTPNFDCLLCVNTLHSAASGLDQTGWHTLKERLSDTRQCRLPVQARAASRTRAIHVYTDGSFTTISAGAAYVVFGWPDKILGAGRFRLSRATSAFSAEVVAFREALRHLLTARYSAPALASPRNAEPHILEIRALIRNLSRNVRVYVYQVPGHSGIFGNEVADYMAERAVRAGLQRSLPHPFRAVRSQLRRELLVLWSIRTATEATDGTSVRTAPVSKTPWTFARVKILVQDALLGQFTAQHQHSWNSDAGSSDRRNANAARSSCRRYVYRAVERGAALALQGQLVEARSEIACLQRQALVAERPLVGDVLAGRAAAAVHRPSGAHGSDTGVPLGAPPTLSGAAGDMTYAAVLRPGPTTGGQPLGRSGFPGVAAAAGGEATMAARHDHANIDPVAKDIRDVTLRYTRYGVTVLTNTRQSLLNMRAAIEQNAVTCAAMTMRVPDRRNPHVRFSGVDPEINPDEFLRLLNERNPNLQLDMERAKVRVTFRERGGTKAFVVEVDPPAYHRIMACPRLSIGWTVVRAYEDLHVSTRTYCASYGHGRSSCPVAGDPSKKRCMRCGTEGHLAADCTVRAGDASVCCAPCRSAGWEASGHPAGHPQCPLLADKVARLLSRTNYGGA